jgi:hypothetical protein
VLSFSCPRFDDYQRPTGLDRIIGYLPGVLKRGDAILKGLRRESPEYRVLGREKKRGELGGMTITGSAVPYFFAQIGGKEEPTQAYYIVHQGE